MKHTVHLTSDALNTILRELNNRRNHYALRAPHRTEAEREDLAHKIDYLDNLRETLTRATRRNA